MEVRRDPRVLSTANDRHEWGAVAGLALSGTADAAEKFVYGLSWLPQAEHCGFFQAKARGLYDAAGLEVDLFPGAPGLNMLQLVAAGRVDAAMGSALTALNMRANEIAGATIAAFFQQSPQTLVAHPDPSLKKLEDLKSRKISSPISRAPILGVAQCNLRLRRQPVAALHV